MQRYICDGCGAEESTRTGVPPNWRSVNLSFSGFNGYPTNLKDFSEESDLCKSCALRLVQNARPRLWESPEKAAEVR